MNTSSPFRQAVLDRLRSPEQLNNLMQVTDAKGWIALAACGVLLVSVVVWGITGRVPTKVSAIGILLHEGGLADISTVADGQIESIEVEAGNWVKKGKVVAHVSQPDMEAQLSTLQAHLIGLNSDYQARKQAWLAAATPTTADASTPTAVEPPDLAAQSLQIDDTRKQIDALNQRLADASAVVAAQDGRVVQVRVAAGDVVAAGTPIVTIERTGKVKSLEAVLYVDSQRGKMVTPGMDVEISPDVMGADSTVLAKVTAVDSFPSTREGLIHALHNEQLVDAFLQETGGIPIAVRAELQTSQNSPSGYKWSSGNGPNLKLTSGTLCTGAVTIATQRPISLVFPALN
jgi:biotin carboxyl carrier protein